MKKILLNIFIIYIFINIISSEKLLKIPFILFSTSIFYHDNPDIITNKYMSQLVIELSIGTPPQKFNVTLDMNDNFYSFFLENNLSNIKFPSLYNKSSLTYKCEQKKTAFPIEIFNQAEVFSDVVNFLNEGKSLEKKIRLLLIDDLFKSIYTPGLIGLALKNDKRQLDENSFLYQLKKYNLTESEIFYFNFDNEKGGTFIIGENLFNNENYLKVKVGYISHISSKLLWSFNFDEIYYGNSTNLGKEDGVLGLSYGLTIGTASYEDIIKPVFLREKNCYLNNTKLGGLDIKYYYCEKEYLIEQKLENLTFELKSVNYSFVFTGEDLFFEEDNKKFFKIIFLFDINQKYWYLGHDFLRKYKIRFDHERKLLYIPFKKKENNNIEENGNDNDNDWNFFKLIKKWQFWIVVSLVIVIIGLIVFIIVYIKKHPKKKPVYELDDIEEDYNYKKKENVEENNIN